MKPIHLWSFISASLLVHLPMQVIAEDDLSLHSELSEQVDFDLVQESQIAQSLSQRSIPAKLQPIKPEPAFVKKNPYCVSHFHVAHVGVRQNQTRGIGYKHGYTTLEGFGIFDQMGSNFMPFIDLRGHIFTSGRLAGNVGIGERSLINSISHIFGVYVYYDVRDVKHDLTVHQISPGIELLGKRMEYRINGYFPVAGKTGDRSSFEFDKFKDHHIIVKSRQRRALTGADAEIGVHLTQSTIYDVYTGVGPYYFTTDHATTWGGKARVLGRFKEYFSLEFGYSYDHLFKNIFQGSIAFTVPFGPKLKRKGKGCPQSNDLLLSRAAFSPSRMEIPVVKNVHRRSVAINPDTNEPWNVWFVDNTSSSAGTFESPYPTLVLAQNASSPNDMIYVFPGDGTTTGMDAGITLKNNQLFFGSGIDHPLDIKQGKITIPAMTRTNPSVANSGGDVVILANANEVSGFNLMSTGTNRAIFGSSRINGANINWNYITAGAVGIIISGVNEINVLNNTIIATASGGVGAEVISDSGLVTGKMSNNVVSGFNTDLQLALVANTSAIYEISGNTVLASGTGIRLGNNVNTSVDCQVLNNTITGDSFGIFANLSSSSSSGTIDIAHNLITGSSTSPGMQLSSGGNLSNYCYQVTYNTVTQGSVGSGGILAGTNGGTSPTVCLNFNGNDASNFGFVVVNNLGTVYLEPITGRNTGNVTLIQTAPITQVHAGTCCIE